MKAFSILVTIVLVLLSGCAEKKAEELSISWGVYDDGMPFWDWEGTLHREISVNGKITFPTGSTAKANFEKNHIIISIISKLTDEDTYTVNGHYASKEPFTFHLLGADKEEGIELKLDEGTGVIDYTGTLETTYTKPSANQSE